MQSPTPFLFHNLTKIRNNACKILSLYRHREFSVAIDTKDSASSYIIPYSIQLHVFEKNNNTFLYYVTLVSKNLRGKLAGQIRSR